MDRTKKLFPYYATFEWKLY